MAPATALALVASAIFLVRLIPQPLRLWRTGVAAGVSAVAAANAVTSASAWFAYGVIHGLPVVWAVSVCALFPSVWTVGLLRREFAAAEMVGAGLVAAVLALSAVAGVLGAALALGVLVTAGPQVWRALRQSDLRGVAPATWGVAVADALSWGIYGVVIADHALEGYGAVLLVSAGVVLGRVAWTRRAARPAAVAGVARA